MMIKRTGMLTVLVLAATLAAADRSPADGPQYTQDGQLMRPQNYREWIFLSSGLGMTYGPLRATGAPRFDNVFASPSAYKAFLETGRWPDKTVLMLEVRNSASQESINRDGHFQTEVVGLEAHVKDESRFPEKWAFFGFRGDAGAAKAVPRGSACQQCHAKEGAVDETFVQFYPTLLKAAKEKGTLKQVK